MNQTLYAHMNKKKKRKEENITNKRPFKYWYVKTQLGYSNSWLRVTFIAIIIYIKTTKRVQLHCLMINLKLLESKLKPNEN
jgi:hypothetical protein